MAAGPMSGVIVKYLPEKGYGFIKPEDADKDVFVHIKAVREGADQMREGAPVEFEMGTDRTGRVRAIKVRITG